MQQNKNIPYVRGVVGEIGRGKVYASPFPNRKARRVSLNEPRFRGNHAGVSLTVTRQNRFVRVIQEVDGKRVGHYLLK
jgi:hypothetical protein